MTLMQTYAKQMRGEKIDYPVRNAHTEIEKIKAAYPGWRFYIEKTYRDLKGRKVIKYYIVSPSYKDEVKHGTIVID